MSVTLVIFCEVPISPELHGCPLLPGKRLVCDCHKDIMYTPSNDSTFRAGSVRQADNAEHKTVPALQTIVAQAQAPTQLHLPPSRLPGMEDEGEGDDELLPAMADDDYSAQLSWQSQSKENLK